MDWTAVTVALVTGILGFVGGLATPWIKWEIEKHKEKRANREAIIAAAINNLSENGSATFLKSKEYSRLRSHLPEKLVRDAEHGRTFVVAPDGRSDNDCFRLLFFDAISDVEAKWGLR